MKIIYIIGRKLPKPIRFACSKIYNKLFFTADKEMVKILAEYCNMTEKEIRWILKFSYRINGDLWHALSPKTAKEVEQYYSTNPLYIFGLAFWHMKFYQIEFRNEIVGFAKGEVLDFGGGIGDLVCELKKRGFECDYADISGRIYAFAKWMFKKKNYKVNMIDLATEKISKQYDTIYCIDVIEHVVNPKETLADMVNHLKNNGRLIITNLDAPESKEHPMHFPINFGAEQYLKSLGMAKDIKPWLWIKSENDK